MKEIKSLENGTLRRSILKSAVGATGVLCSVIPASARPVPGRYSYELPLRKTAAPKGIFYGTCTEAALLDIGLAYPNNRYDEVFCNAVKTECNIVVAEGGTKWNAIHPTPNSWDFTRTDRLLRFAQANNMAMRGHTLLWHAAMPSWLEEQLKVGGAASIMENHIHTVVSRYKGKLLSWDVVNEAIAPDLKLWGDSLRVTPWLQALGPSYIELAYRFAAEADPDVQLVYNDFDIETRPYKATAVLNLLRRLKDKYIPIHAVGLQGHIYNDSKFGHLKEFCKEVRKLDLEIIITELDVYESVHFEDDRIRDRAVSDRVREMLDSIFSVYTPKQILTWGLTDRYSWLSSPIWNKWKNPKGRQIRGLPLDPQFRRKSMWGVLHKYISEA